MRPFLALAAAFAILAGSQLYAGKKCDLKCAATATASAQAPAASFCQRFCASKAEYNEADVMAQPGAVAGRLARCPVSGVVFEVKRGRNRVTYAGHDYYMCCGRCEKAFRMDPARFLKA